MSLNTKRTVATLLSIFLLLTSCGTSDSEQANPDELLDGEISITLNPNDITPLAAQAAFKTKVPTKVSVTIMGEEPLTHTFEETATEHVIPVLGLYPNTKNRVKVRVTEPGGKFIEKILEITTDPLPDFFPVISVKTAERASMEDGWTLSKFSVSDDGNYRTFPLFFDTNGDVRWYLDASFTGGRIHMTEQRRANGHLLFTYGRTIYEYDMLGKEIKRWNLEGYKAHHELIEKSDGNFLIAVDKVGIDTIEDHIIEIDGVSGDIVTVWDLRQILDVNREDFNYVENDWFHMNAMFYNETDDTLIVSGRNQAVVKITRNNELVWILAPHKGWGKAGINADGQDTSDFLLTAVNDNGVPYSEAVQQGEESTPDFDWAWGHHAPLLLPNGHLFVFDNGLKRNFGAGASYSRGVEYAIDESVNQVKQAWSYGKERGREFYSSIISDVDYLPTTGNRLIMPGIVRPDGPFYALVTEVTYPEGDVVFEAKLQFKNLLSPTPELGAGYIDIVYRSDRMLLYPQ